MSLIKSLSVPLLITALCLPLLPVAVSAQTLDMKVMEFASDGLDTCIVGKVDGLRVGGDGFLAVRSGPNSKATKLDEIHNGDRVWVFDEFGDWLGIVYDVKNPGCSPITVDRPVPSFGGKIGWVHKNWIVILAG